MSLKYVYLLEHVETGQPTVIGIFDSKEAAESALRPLDKAIAYAIYELPFNTIITEGPQLEDQQGIYEHWHYGTHNDEFVETDEDGNILKQGTETLLEWPD